ncbi:MAG: SRPBCC family protein, partial [Bacteroidia bacterium]|nr:SRPBCC family protein [Bacteroidia bacterium]
MNLESPKVTIDKSSQETFNFLSDVKNFEKLMPENISKFEVLDTDKFLFALKGMPEIVLKKREASPNNKIVLG